MADNTPQSREEALLQNILGAQNELEAPRSRIEKIWAYALGIDGVELEPAKSRIEVLAIQVAELVRNGGGSTPTGTISITANGEYDVTQYAGADVAVPEDHTVEDGIIDRSISGDYTNSRITNVGLYAFRSCSQLTSISLPAAETFGQAAFEFCSAAQTINLPAATSFGTSCFNRCASMTVLNLYSPTRSTIPTLAGTNAFTNTPIASGTGYIVINDELVDTLKAASNWTAYSAQIVGRSEALQSNIISA